MKVLITTVPFGDKKTYPVDLLEQSGVEYLINPLGKKLTEEELAGMVSDVDIIIAGTEPITDYVMSCAPNLIMISRVGIGLDSVDLLAAERRNIIVSYTPDAPAPAVSELALGLVLSLLRSVQVSNMKMHEGKWNRYFGRRLSETTIAIVGVGRTGKGLLKHLSGFDCKRILVNDILENISLDEFNNIEWVDKQTIYKEADVISLHLPLTIETKNMIKKEELNTMKQDAIIVNTSRGGIINEADLCDTLQTGHLSGAAIDVFEDEPYSGPLNKIDNCLLTAHMGSMSVDCRTQMEAEATEEVLRFIKGETLIGVVPDKEYEVQRLAL